MLTWCVALVMVLTFLPARTLAAGGGNYFYFMSDTGSDAVVVATKVLHENDEEITDFTDVRVPLDTTHGVTGWYADKKLTTSVTTLSYDAARLVPVPLYPKVEKGFWVTFESNGGTYMAPQFFTEQTSEPANEPTKFGYDFAGWYADEALTQKAEFASISSAITLYADWTARDDTKYTVLYWQENAEDNEYSYVESEYQQGTTGEETAVVAKEYEGFTAEPITQQTIAGDGTTIVNVKYKRNVYDVRFWNVLYTVGHYGELAEEFEDLRITAKYGANIRDQWPRDFDAAWEVEIESWHFQANIDVMPLGGQNFYRVNPFGNESAEYYVEDLNGEYVLDHTDTGAPFNSAISEEDRYDIGGFTYKEYITTKPKFWSDRDQCYYDEYSGAKFYYTRNSYSVAYMNKSKNPVRETLYKYEADISNAAAFVPDRPYGVPENYTFKGWYKDPECTEEFDFADKTMPAHNVTVYANWVAPICDVKFVAYSEDIKTLEDVPYGTDIANQIPQVNLHEGDEFYGWTYDEAGTRPFNEGTKITSSIVLYAQTGNKNGYTVTYDANGGTGTVPTDPYCYARNRLAMVLSSNGLTAPAGKTFQGWNTAADGSGTMYQSGDSISVSGNITLYAIWKNKHRPNPPHAHR